MSKKFSVRFKAEALRLLGTGVSTREAQAQLRKRFKGEHVGEGTLRKWAKDAEAAGLADELDAIPVDTRPAPEPDAPTPADPIADVYEHTQRQLATAQRRADEAARDGNHTAAQRFSKQVVDYTLLLARLDKDKKADTDAVTIPRAELDRARAWLRDMIGSLQADLARTGGLTCNHCGREIRLAIAKGEKEGNEKV